MVKVLGGKVERSEKGWGVGIKKTDILNKKKWMKPFLNSYNVLVSHKDQVSKIPPDAEILAANEHCSASMIQVGSHFLGIQGHPEFSKDYSKTLMQSRLHLIEEEKVVEAVESFSNLLNTKTLVSWIIQFIKNHE